MCDLIEIRLNTKDERRIGKGNLKKKMDLDVFYDVTHDTSQRFIIRIDYRLKFYPFKTISL